MSCKNLLNKLKILFLGVVVSNTALTKELKIKQTPNQNQSLKQFNYNSLGDDGGFVAGKLNKYITYIENLNDKEMHDEGMRLFETLTDYNYQFIFLSIWAEKNPHAALAFTRKTHNMQDNDSYIYQTWAATSPDSLFKYFQKFPGRIEIEAKRPAGPSYNYGYTEKSKAITVELLDSHPHLVAKWVRRANLVKNNTYFKEYDDNGFETLNAIKKILIIDQHHKREQLNPTSKNQNINHDVVNQYINSLKTDKTHPVKQTPITRFRSLLTKSKNWNSDKHKIEVKNLIKKTHGEFNASIKIILHSWGKIAPRQALSFLDELDKQQNDNNLIQSRYKLITKYRKHVFAGWARTNPLMAWNTLKTEPEPNPQRIPTAKNLILSEWVNQDPKSALQKSAYFSEANWLHLLQKQPALVSEHIKKFTKLSDFKLIFPALAKHSWNDAEKALSPYKNNKVKETNDHNFWIEIYLPAMALQNLNKAVDQLSLLSNKQDKKWAWQYMLEKLIEEKPKELYTFLKARPNRLISSPHKKELNSQLLISHPDIIAKSAKKYFVNNNSKWPTGFDLYDLLESWTRINTDQAKKWVLALPEGEAKQNALQTYIHLDSGKPINERKKMALMLKDPKAQANLIKEIDLQHHMGWNN